MSDDKEWSVDLQWVWLAKQVLDDEGVAPADKSKRIDSLLQQQGFDLNVPALRHKADMATARAVVIKVREVMREQPTTPSSGQGE